jgi:cytochrome c biogenesis protein CcmG, thiol:disulfide interchange protein DsbE
MKRFIAMLALSGIYLLWNPSIVSAQFFEAGVQKVEPPVEAPDFTLNVLGGGKISLKELRRKVVLLNFFSPWCTVCQKEASSFDKLSDALRGKDVVLLPISSQATEEETLKFKKEFKISLPILMDNDGAVGKGYRLFGLHETFFINREGKIIGKAFEGGKQWTSPNMIKLIETLLKASK